LRHFVKLLDELQRQLLEMAALVESTIHRGVTAAVDRSSVEARAVLSQQQRINELELGIDEFVTSLLALHQPVAKDLRLITASLKISSDLRRMGELSVNIAQRSISLSERPPVPFPGDLIDIAHRVQIMVSKSLQAFAQREENLAAEVLAADDHVDQLRTAMYGDLVKLMEEQPRTAAQDVDLMFIVHNLERIADHATNIAEDVLLFIGGGKRRLRWLENADDKHTPLDMAPDPRDTTVSERSGFK
jgi:phosphate transport system protein